MRGYYSESLSGERLRRCYEIASPRIRQYLEAEIQHIIQSIDSSEVVLELGCGYGRIAMRLAEKAKRVVGIDNALESVMLARNLAADETNCLFFLMDALNLAFNDRMFDRVVCAQNGICAFGVDQELLVREALRVTRPGGRILLSGYSEGFWEERLSWFEAQAQEGLLGEIDYRQTGNNVIVCKDGFRSGNMTGETFLALCSRLGLDSKIVEVDGSSVFCEIEVTRMAHGLPFSETLSQGK